jgi:hypothetical protein
MQLTDEQFEQSADLLPRQRGNVSLDNLQLINAILYVAPTAASGARCLNTTATGTPSIHA